MIIVTGGAGFIGSNLVAALNRSGEADILIVDRITDSKLANLTDLHFADFMSVDAFRNRIAEAGPAGFGQNRVRAVFHQGACSDTMVTDGEYVLDNNYNCSKELLHWCIDRKTPFVYASSASVYGSGTVFTETPDAEQPLNLYATSKWMFDRYVRRYVDMERHHVVGLRYFNVYGSREFHKQRMASVVLHFSNQFAKSGCVSLFAGSDGYANGEQRRDFVFVDDVAKVNLWAAGEGARAGIYNVGTGRSRSFNTVAAAVVNGWRAKQQDDALSTAELVAHGLINYTPMPEALSGKYQSYTEADLGRLRAGGYDAPFTSVEAGVAAYIEQLSAAAAN